MLLQHSLPISQRPLRTDSNVPWGDTDGDSLQNWREQSAGTDPNKADTEGCAGLVRWKIWRAIPGRYVFDLRRAGHFPTGPSELRYLDRMEIPTGNGRPCRFVPSKSPASSSVLASNTAPRQTQ